MKNLKILAAVMMVTLGGCIHEGGPPPPPDIRGQWFAAHTAGDTELQLFDSFEGPRTALLGRFAHAAEHASATRSAP